MVTIELASDEPSTDSAEFREKEDVRNLHCDEADNSTRDGECLAKHEDDDWETASEGDDVEDRPSDSNPSASGAILEGFEDALTEEEQKQKALSQANAAKAEGNTFYAAGSYEDALACYTNALDIVPEPESSKEIRAMCHSNCAACFFQLARYQEAIGETTKALELDPAYLKALIRRAQSHEKLDQLDEALSDYNKVLELNPGNQQARASARRLEPIVGERREKLKEEMIGKLKDLGNTVLGKFGMSIDNFKAVKDPNTGSYSVSFQR